MLRPGQVRELTRVVDEDVPRGNDRAFAVAATVADRVQRVHGDAVLGEPAGERFVEAGVLPVAVDEDDDADLVSRFLGVFAGSVPVQDFFGPSAVAATA